MLVKTNQKQAFKNRVHHWAAKLDVKIAWLGVRPMRNKWASCSTNGQLNFNDELPDLDQITDIEFDLPTDRVRSFAKFLPSSSDKDAEFVPEMILAETDRKSVV